MKDLDQELKYVRALEIVMVRNLYYYDSFRRLMLICLALFLCIFFLVYCLIYEQKHIPPPVYFATDFNGAPIPIIPLARANLKPNALLEWATHAATAAYTFNFVNYRRSLQNTRSYFTRNGYQNFLKALKDSNNLDAVQKKKLVVFARVLEGGTPIILKDSNSDPTLRIDGAFTWQVQVPMLLTYVGSGQAPILQRIILTMYIRRVSTLESTDGVGIDSFVIQEVIV